MTTTLDFQEMRARAYINKCTLQEQAIYEIENLVEHIIDDVECNRDSASLDYILDCACKIVDITQHIESLQS